MELTEVTKFRRAVLTGLARFTWQGTLPEHIYDILYSVVTEDSPRVRCCVHKERAVLKNRINMALGLTAVELNAYESSTSAVENSLDEGGYTVTSIEYKGINQDIISGGFGLSKQMNLQISDTPEIPFYIGSDSTALSGLFIVRDGKQVKTASEQSTQQTSVTTQDTTNTTETVQDTSEENATESTRKDPDKEDVVEVVKEKKKGKKSQFFPFSFKKLLMAVIILFICGVWTLVFYQKNKYFGFKYHLILKTCT